MPIGCASVGDLRGGPTEAKGSAGAIQPASRASASSPQVSTTPDAAGAAGGEIRKSHFRLSEALGPSGERCLATDIEYGGRVGHRRDR